MRKVHISLVGRETAPVYLGIIEADPDLVILVHSSDTKEETDRIIKELPSLNVIKKEFDPTDLGKIYFEINRIQRNLQEDDVISLNLVGGTKFWSLAFYDKFKERENVSIYLIDQQNNLWDIKNQKAKQLEFDMEKNFKLYGNPLTKYDKLDSFTQEDFQVVKTIEKIRKHKDFLNLTSFLDKAKQNELDTKSQGEFSLPTGSIVEWFKPDCAIVYLNKKDKPIEAELKSPKAVNILFNTHWFEIKIAKLLSEIYPIENIYLNCKFPTKQGSDKNEVDIVVNTGKKLLFIECKTQVKNPTDIDKFATVVRNYGGKGSKALLITEANIKPAVVEKCRESNISHFALQEYQNKNEKVLIDGLKKQLNRFISGVNK